MNAKIYKYKNGATLLYRSLKNCNMTSVRAGFYAGSYYNDGIDGLAHLTEHMLFNKTKKRTHEDIVNDKVKIAYIGAGTSSFMIMMHFEQSNRRIKESFELCSDIMLNSEFDDEYLTQEISVVDEEYKSKVLNEKYNLDYICTKNLYTVLPTIENRLGKKKDLSKLTTSDIKKHIEKHFVSDKFVISVASSLPFFKVKKLVNNYFVKNLRSPSAPSPIVPYVPVEIKTNEAIYTVQKDDEKVYKVRVLIRYDVEPDEFRFDYSSDFIAYILGTVSGLFHEETRIKGLAYEDWIGTQEDVLATNNSLNFNFKTGSFENVEEIFKIICSSIKKIKYDDIITKELVDNYKENLYIREDFQHFTSASNRAYNALTFYHARGDLNKLTKKQVHKNISKLTVETAKNIVNRIFNKDNQIYICMVGNFNDVEVKTVKDYKKIIFKGVK